MLLQTILGWTIVLVPLVATVWFYLFSLKKLPHLSALEKFGMGLIMFLVYIGLVSTVLLFTIGIHQLF
jgi:hypothetical protein